MTIQKYNEPFDYWIIDNLLDEEFARKLSSQFPDYNSKDWLFYDNPLENKKSINDWVKFPAETYKFMSNLVSQEYVSSLSELTGNENLYADAGLHGGGWHIHGNGGKLNVHMDYSVHPKLNLVRKYNLIIYLSEDWQSEWGGNLEFWSHDDETNQPKEKVVTIENKFNRAVIFDASQNSWHGFYDKIQCPEGKVRKSIASYYLTNTYIETPIRRRALYSPSPDQKNDTEVLNFIKKRTQ